MVKGGTTKRRLRHGEPLFRKRGHRRTDATGRTHHEVVLTQAELAPFAGRAHLFSHNHPTDSSFTLDDVSMMAFLDVREGNAFRQDVRYRLIRKADRWPPPSRLWYGHCGSE